MFFSGNGTRSINMLALHRRLGHRDFPTLRRWYDHKGSRVRGRRVVPYFSNLRGRIARYGYDIGIAGLSTGGLYSSTKAQRKAKKKICLFPGQDTEMHIPGTIWLPSTKSCQECAGNRACHQLGDFRYFSRSNSVKCSKVSFQVLNVTKMRRS